MSPPGLKELLAAAEARKYAGIRKTLGIAPEAAIPNLQLDSLAYHLTERSGEVHVRFVSGMLRVGEPGGATFLSYDGEAAEVVLRVWNISKEQAQAGVTFEVENGRRKIPR